MYFEDFRLGQVYQVEPVSLTEDEIRKFAEKYDPLPLHTDPEFAKHQRFGGLIASGFQTLITVWGKWTHQNRLGAEVIGGLGIDYLKWTAPVYPGDVLRGEVEVSDLIPSSKKGRGILGMKMVVRNQKEQVVLETRVKALMKSREN